MSVLANICDIFFHDNRINAVLVTEIFHYKGNTLIFVRIFKAITLNLMSKLSPFLYMSAYCVHFLI